jgi:hypothetical protein
MYPDFAAILTSPFIIPVVGIIVAIGVPVISSVWADVEKHRRDTELKRCMIERGMSVEEIERVLAARTPSAK